MRLMEAVVSRGIKPIKASYWRMEEKSIIGDNPLLVGAD